MSVLNYLENESKSLTSNECKFIIDVINLRTYPGSVSRTAAEYEVDYIQVLDKLKVLQR